MWESLQNDPGLIFPPPLFLWYCDLPSVLQEEIKHSGELFNFQKDCFFFFFNACPIFLLFELVTEILKLKILRYFIA